MKFNRLRLTGFKSFCEGTDFLIEPGLTGVVGPNGCGKSNILDATRWVLGEDNPRELRVAALSDIIHAGTAARRAGDKVLGVFVGELQRAGAPDPQIRLDKGRRSGVKSTS
jgi:chromosome segregation ATPase